PVLHLRREALPIRAPTERSVKTLSLGSLRAQHRVLEKRAVVSMLRSRWAEAGVRRSLRMLHGLDGLGIGAQSQPADDLPEPLIGIGQHMFAVNQQLSIRRNGLEKLVNVLIQCVPTALRIQAETVFLGSARISL